MRTRAQWHLGHGGVPKRGHLRLRGSRRVCLRRGVPGFHHGAFPHAVARRLLRARRRTPARPQGHFLGLGGVHRARDVGHAPRRSSIPGGLALRCRHRGAVGGGLGAFPHVLRHGALPRIAARGHSGRRHRADRLAASVQLLARALASAGLGLHRPVARRRGCCPVGCHPPYPRGGADQRHRAGRPAPPHRRRRASPGLAPRLPHRALRGPRRLRPRAHAHPLHTNGHRERRRGCLRPRAGAGWGGGGHRRYPHRPGHDEREDPLHAAAVLRRHHAVSHGGRLAGAGAASLGVPDEHRPPMP